MKKALIALSLVILSTGMSYAESKYNFSDPNERRAAQQALSESYTKQNVDRLVKNLERAVQNNASYSAQAKAALPGLKELQNALQQ